MQYLLTVSLPPEPLLGSLLDLLTVLFTNQSREEWLADLRQKATYPDLQVWLALEAGQVVGFKLGYQWPPNKQTFYSWLGGVAPASQGQGVAGELMRLQHEAAQEAGYLSIRTHTYNQWRQMLILNLRHGFDIVSTQSGKHGLTIALEKSLPTST